MATLLDRWWERLAILGSIVLGAASIPTWFTVHIDPEVAAAIEASETMTRGGIGGDGILTLVLAVIVLVAVAVVSYRSRSGAGTKTAALTTVSGLAATLIGYLAWSDFQELEGYLAELASGGNVEATVADAMSAEVHLALYVVLLGSIVVLAAGLLGLYRSLA